MNTLSKHKRILSVKATTLATLRLRKKGKSPLLHSTILRDYHLMQTILMLHLARRYISLSNKSKCNISKSKYKACNHSYSKCRNSFYKNTIMDLVTTLPINQLRVSLSTALSFNKFNLLSTNIKAINILLL